MVIVKRFINRMKRKSNRIKKIKLNIKLHNILLLIIIFKIYGIKF